MVLVTVRDSDPLVEMKCSEIDPRTLYQQRGSLVKKVMDSVQEHYPNFDDPLYRCLQSPDEWLNDHVLVQFVKHLQHGMPVPDQAVSDVVFGPGFVDFKHEGNNKIDFGSLCVKLSFRGGFSRCSIVPYPVQGILVIITPENL